MQKLLNNIFVQNLWALKCKNDIKMHILLLYNDVSFQLVMFWCEICIIYILIKFVQLSWCNFASNFVIFEYETFTFTYVNKKNVLFVWIFKTLNKYKYCSYYHDIEFIQFLNKHMKNGFCTKFVRTYETR